MAILRPHFGDPFRQRVSRITRRYFYCRNNEVSESRYRRGGSSHAGYPIGAYTWTPTVIANVDALEEWMKARGLEEWDSGWRPERR